MTIDDLRFEISDDEMKELMIGVVNNCYLFLSILTSTRATKYVFNGDTLVSTVDRQIASGVATAGESCPRSRLDALNISRNSRVVVQRKVKERC
jgi:hypothetical protein